MWIFFAYIIVVLLFMALFLGYRKYVRLNDISLLENEIDHDFIEEKNENGISSVDQALEWLEQDQKIEEIKRLNTKP